MIRVARPLNRLVVRVRIIEGFVGFVGLIRLLFFRFLLLFDLFRVDASGLLCETRDFLRRKNHGRRGAAVDDAPDVKPEGFSTGEERRRPRRGVVRQDEAARLLDRSDGWPWAKRTRLAGGIAGK